MFPVNDKNILSSPSPFALRLLTQIPDNTFAINAKDVLLSSQDPVTDLLLLLSAVKPTSKVKSLKSAMLATFARYISPTYSCTSCNKAGITCYRESDDERSFSTVRCASCIKQGRSCVLDRSILQPGAPSEDISFSSLKAVNEYLINSPIVVNAFSGVTPTVISSYNQFIEYVSSASRPPQASSLETQRSSVQYYASLPASSNEKMRWIQDVVALLGKEVVVGETINLTPGLINDTKAIVVKLPFRIPGSLGGGQPAPAGMASGSGGGSGDMIQQQQQQQQQHEQRHQNTHYQHQPQQDVQHLYTQQHRRLGLGPAPLDRPKRNAKRPRQLSVVSEKSSIAGSEMSSSSTDMQSILGIHNSILGIPQANRQAGARVPSSMGSVGCMPNEMVNNRPGNDMDNKSSSEWDAYSDHYPNDIAEHATLQHQLHSHLPVKPMPQRYPDTALVNSTMGTLGPQFSNLRTLNTSASYPPPSLNNTGSSFAFQPSTGQHTVANLGVPGHPPIHSIAFPGESIVSHAYDDADEDDEDDEDDDKNEHENHTVTIKPKESVVTDTARDTKSSERSTESFDWSAIDQELDQAVAGQKQRLETMVVRGYDPVDQPEARVWLEEGLGAFRKSMKEVLRLTEESDPIYKARLIIDCQIDFTSRLLLTQPSFSRKCDRPLVNMLRRQKR